MEQAKRTRGGQIGNRNALRHGYYSRILSEEEKADLCSAADVEGLDEEIALLCHVIKQAASLKDEKHFLLVVRAATALNRLIRTRHNLQDDRDNLKGVVENVLENALYPLGIGPEKLYNSVLFEHERSWNESSAEPAPDETKNESSKLASYEKYSFKKDSLKTNNEYQVPLTFIPVSSTGQALSHEGRGDW